MKIIALALSIAAFILPGNISFAENIVATVDTVTMARAQGEYSSVKVIDEYGCPVIFDVDAETLIYDVNDKPMDIKNIRQNDTLEIEYDSLIDGVGMAKSIKRTNE